MSRQGLNQQKSLSHSSSTPAKTGSFQSRPFAEPADSEAVSTQQQETPDLQTQLDKAARFGHHFGRVRVGNTSSVIQPKLTVGAPGDKYEQEADQVAAQVIGMAEPTNQQPVQREMALEEEQESVQTKPLAASITPLVQREVAAAPEEEENLLQTQPLAGSNLQRDMGSEPEEEELLQTKPSLQRATTEGSFEAGSNLENRLSSSKSGGSLLSHEVRSFMEPRFGADFSQVRVHTDSEAVQMNKDLGAQAFTHGQDIYFGEGKSPGISELTAHELTHVVQQTEGIQTKPAIDRIGQQQPRVQREPLTLATLGIGGALGSMTVVDAAAVAGAVIGASATAVQAGAAVQPGASGVQTVQLENGWMSNVDKQKLEMMTQYRLINAYVRQWAAAHPGQSLAHPEREETSTTTTTTTTTTPTSSRRRPSTTTGESTAVTTTEGGPATSGSEVDQAIRAAVKAEVQLQLEQDLNRHQKTFNSQEYIWSDSGDHTADTFGTVGSIQFVQMRGTALRETLQLSPEASQIPGLVVPMAGTEVVVTQFRGGRLVRGPSMETGLNDDLGINLVGSGPTFDQAGNSGHGTHTYATEWNWDDNTTSAEFDVMIQEDGMPKIDPPRWSGTPED
jgi:hypothetical protein